MSKSRLKKFQTFLELANPNENSKILDVGAADREYSPVDNYLEKKYSYPENITALSIYPLVEFEIKYPKVKVVTFSGGRFPFHDKEFSIAYSNAVLEHVGGWEQQLLFIQEMSRVANAFYLTTPAKEFPIEQHTNFPFIHWLPKRYYNSAVDCLGKGWAAGDYLNLLNYARLNSLLQEAGLKNYSIHIQRICFFPLHYTVFSKA